MRFLCVLVALFVAFGSLVPHAALAHRHPAPTAHAAHDMGTSHSKPADDCTGCKGDCVGCAAPVRMIGSPNTGPVLAGPKRLPFQPTSLAGFTTRLELPPPRPIA